ncbi:MAG: hypothetical protein JWN96_3534 [Mycobacterium sp.]|jgi:hypothetical protein|nr:hypothetical protein [Mycobacterium sp.]
MRVRRLGATVAASVAVTAGIAIGVVFAVGSSTDTSSSSVKPAPVISPKAAPALATTSGIDVTWLPPGFSRELGGGTTTTKAGGTSTVQDFAGALPPDGSTSAPHLTLNVQRGPGSADSEFAKIGSPTSAVTIRGHNAQLFSLPPDNSEASKNEPMYLIEWAEQPNLTLSISAFWGATLADAKGVAAGLVVHDAEPIKSQLAAEAEIRAAFQHAYTGGTAIPTVMDAVENGDSMAPLLAELHSKAPETARTARITVTSVTLTDADHANVEFSLTSVYQGQPSNLAGGQGAVRVNGKWKVSEAGYCGILSQAGVTCPAS